jgi:SPP1 gp7 family putative phage head morphogenesis protein
MAPKRKPHAEPFHRPKRIEASYARTLEEIFGDWIDFPAIKSLDDLFSRMIRMADFTPAQTIDRIARSMVTAVAHGNAISWREAARTSTEGGRIYALLRNEMRGPVGVQVQRMIEANAKLIRTLPADIARDVTKQVATRQRAGERSSEIAKDMMRRFPLIAQSRIQLIARTEVAKAAEAITRARSQALNLNWYQWLTAEDVRVRQSHKNLDLVLVNWNDAPSPEQLVSEKNVGHYHAGNIWNCRCASAVVVDLGQVSWPARVYRNGRIVRMSRQAFAKIAGVEVEK